MAPLSKEVFGRSLMLRIDNISVRFGTTTILDEVSTEFKPGQIVALCGPNGAGKSTLLRVISGELSANNGQVSWANQSISQWKANELAKSRAKLSQESRLSFPFLTQEVVEMGRYPYGNNPENQVIIDRCIKDVQIEHLIDRRYDTLSGGEKQRVHLARVLAQLSSTEQTGNIKLLLLDEPTSALDLKHQESVLQLVHTLVKRENYLVIIVLHDLNLAAAWADTMVMMKDGRLKYSGGINEICTQEVLQDVYNVPTIILNHPTSGRPIISVDRM